MLGQLVPQQQVPRQVTDKVLITDQLAVHTAAADQGRRARHGIQLAAVGQDFAQQVVVRIVIGQQCHDTALVMGGRLHAQNSGNRRLGGDFHFVGWHVARVG